MKTDIRIAMWSGPRTRSTAMMRAWENRADTTVVDEPLYAYYLAHTDVADPGRDEVIASRPTDWRQVVDELTHAPLPAERPVHYQKHLTQHLLPEVDQSAFKGLRHAHLIRHPAEMLASYDKVQAPTVDELGLRQQLDLYRTFGGPVVDTDDLVQRPEPVLRLLCEQLGVDFTPRMLSWPAGRRSSDGVWGRHWYQGVWKSTGFTASEPASHDLPEHLLPVLEQCLPIYDELRARRISA